MAADLDRAGQDPGGLLQAGAPEVLQAGRGHSGRAGIPAGPGFLRGPGVNLQGRGNIPAGLLNVMY